MNSGAKRLILLSDVMKSRMCPMMQLRSSGPKTAIITSLIGQDIVLDMRIANFRRPMGS